MPCLTFCCQQPDAHIREKVRFVVLCVSSVSAIHTFTLSTSSVMLHSVTSDITTDANFTFCLFNVKL